MRNKLIAILAIVVTLSFGYFLWNKYLKVDDVIVNETPVETVKTSDIVVNKDNVSTDLDKNVNEMEKELEGLDIEKDLADFKDLTW